MTVLRGDGPGCACVCHRPKRMGPVPLWTAEMDRTLVAALNRGEHRRTIAAELRLSDNAVGWRVRQLGLSLRQGWRSRYEIIRVLGTTSRCVNRWMRDGQLRVRRHGTRWTRVTNDDLRAFVVAQAGLLFDAARVRDPALRSLAETSAAVNRRRAV